MGGEGHLVKTVIFDRIDEFDALFGNARGDWSEKAGECDKHARGPLRGAQKPLRHAHEKKYRRNPPRTVPITFQRRLARSVVNE